MWSIPTAGVIRRHSKSFILLPGVEFLKNEQLASFGGTFDWKPTQCCAGAAAMSCRDVSKVQQPMAPTPHSSPLMEIFSKLHQCLTWWECSQGLSVLMIKYHLPWQILDDWCDRHKLRSQQLSWRIFACGKTSLAEACDGEVHLRLWDACNSYSDANLEQLS